MSLSLKRLPTRWPVLLTVLTLLGAANSAGLAGAAPEVSAVLQRAADRDGEAILKVSLRLPQDSTTNSILMPPGKKGATKVEYETLTGVEPLLKLTETPDPRPVKDPATGQEAIKHVGEVIFHQRMRLTGPTAAVQGSLNFVFCQGDVCQKLNEPFTASLDTEYKTSSVALLQEEKGNAFEDLAGPTDLGVPGEAPAPGKLGGDLEFNLSPPDESGNSAALTAPVVHAEVHPIEGQSDAVLLQITVDVPAEHYTYSQNKKANPKPTRITIDEISGLTPADATFSESPEAKPYFDKDLNRQIEKHTEKVVFSRKYTVTDLAGVKSTGLTGNVSLLLCKAGNCTPYPNLGFKAQYHATSVEVGIPLAGQVVVGRSADTSTLWGNLFLAFVGGIILNVMPCVLPVIGIKVVSFVEQSGENRWRVFALNWTYAAGSLLVFLILGTLAALFSMNSGEAFQSDAFKIVFGVVVFAMALSLLGVFELNLPGVATGFGLSEQKEGLIGAFMSGVVATFLATPCIGPFMGSALGWSVGKPPLIIYAIWMTLGLGMSLPYLILGLAPRLVSWLPRPGMWMVRFKQISGFLLLATVLFLIQPLERRTKVAPAADTANAVVSADSPMADGGRNHKDVEKPLTGVLIALLGMGIGLWMIGNLYNHASSGREKWKVRVAAMAVAAPLMWYGVADQFGLRILPNSELAWEPWTEERMQSHLADGKPLLIDFTADWCTTCKFNEATALNRADTKKFVEKNNIIAMKADFTDESPEIKKWIAHFKKSGVPILVVFPPGESREPIITDGIVTQGQVIEILEQAMKRGTAQQAQTQGTTAAMAIAPGR
jgi:suppressor for copper-sensitivity B